MELEGLKYIGIGLTALGFLGAALGIGNIFSTAISSIARNPSTESKISKYVLLHHDIAWIHKPLPCHSENHSFSSNKQQYCNVTHTLSMALTVVIGSFCF